MTDKERIKELEEKVAYYEGLPTAKFYTSMVNAIEHLTQKIDNKELDFDSDPFAKSIFVLAKDSDKIMLALGKGIEVFKQIEQDNTGKGKKADKSGTKAI